MTPDPCENRLLLTADDDDEVYGRTAFSYTLTQAVESGAFIRVPEHLARAAGIDMPVVITTRAWEAYAAGPDEHRRLENVLTSAVKAIAQASPDEIYIDVRTAPEPSCEPGTPDHAPPWCAPLLRTTAGRRK
ncbi:hypothetical protein AB0D11_43660 [Streptomyces monashensis]|uniref:hypothetical protein n=1 Tax=Streptomyces monashensis TaxID=1678012 RepID=UPI0033D5BF67